MAPADDVRAQRIRMQEKWVSYLTSNKEHKLYWAVVSTYKWEFLVAIFWNIIIATFQLSTPFILRRLIMFI